MRRALPGAWLAPLGLLAALLSSTPALAQDETEAEESGPRFGGQRIFGFGPAAGFYSGMGALVSLQPGPVGVVVSGGYMPLFIFGNDKETREVTFDYYGSGQFNTDLVIGPVYTGRKVRIDLLFGYRYNKVLGHGGGAGVRFALDVSRLLRLEFHWTPHIFPAAVDRLDDEGYPSDRDPSLPEIQGGIGAAAVFYP